ncbi:hypothetical protein DEMA109039_22640 [Deinococcus marmoris]
MGKWDALPAGLMGEEGFVAIYGDVGSLIKVEHAQQSVQGMPDQITRVSEGLEFLGEGDQGVGFALARGTLPELFLAELEVFISDGEGALIRGFGFPDGHAGGERLDV